MTWVIRCALALLAATALTLAGVGMHARAERLLGVPVTPAAAAPTLRHADPLKSSAIAVGELHVVEGWCE